MQHCEYSICSLQHHFDALFVCFVSICIIVFALHSLTVILSLCPLFNQKDQQVISTL